MTTKVMYFQIFHFHQELLIFSTKQEIEDEVRTFSMHDYLLRESPSEDHATISKARLQKKFPILLF
jgi:hypothetical protein